MDWFAKGSDVLTDPRTWAFAEALGVSVPTAAGHLDGIYGMLAKHGDEHGQLDTVPDAMLEHVALWRGAPGTFAAAFRTHYQDTNGTLHRWREWNGATIAHAKKGREKKRRQRDEWRAKALAKGDSPNPRPEDSPEDKGRDWREYMTGQDMTGHDQLQVPTTPESPDGDRGGWVAEAVRRWAAQVGVVTHGRMGKALRPAVALYGEAAVLEAIDRFGAWRSRRDPGPRGELPGLPQFVATIRTHIPPTMLGPAAGEAS